MRATPLGVRGVIAPLVLVPIMAAGQEAADLSGRWTGECFRCAATGFTLVLVQAGSELTGTLAATGTPNFGDGDQPILNGNVAGRKVAFQVRGNPGDVFGVELTASRDAKTLSGNGDNRGSFGLRFRRAP